MTAPASRRQPTPDATAGSLTTPILIVLALLSAVAPLSIDLYLPSFPEMGDEFSASATQVQLTLTAFLAGLTLGQLLFGPLSDRFGRMRPLIAGAVLCVAASVLAVAAPSIGVLIGARFVQGLGGAAGMVIGRAIISDLTTGKAAARAFSLMMIVGGVAPVLGPVVGGALADPIGWRGILSVVLALSVLMLVCSVLVLRESHPAQRRAQLRAARDDDGSSWFSAFASRGFVCYTLTFGFGFAVMMAYISASPFVYQDMMGFNAAEYGLAFGLNALALMAVSAVAARLVHKVDPHRLLGVGVATITAATVLMVVLSVTGVPPVWLMIPLFFAVASEGLILGNATGLALGSVPTAAGGASAVLGALQFGLAAAVSPLVSLGGKDTAVPLSIVMIVSAAIAAAAFAAAGPAHAPNGSAD